MVVVLIKNLVKIGGGFKGSTGKNEIAIYLKKILSKKLYTKYTVL